MNKFPLDLSRFKDGSRTFHSSSGVEFLRHRWWYNFSKQSFRGPIESRAHSLIKLLGSELKGAETRAIESTIETRRRDNKSKR